MLLLIKFVFLFSLCSIVLTKPQSTMKRSASMNPLGSKYVILETKDYDSALKDSKLSAKQISALKVKYISTIFSYFFYSYPEREDIFVFYNEKLEAGYLQDQSIENLFSKAYVFVKSNGDQLGLLNTISEKDRLLLPIVRYFEDQMAIASMSFKSAPNDSTIPLQPLPLKSIIVSVVDEHLKYTPLELSYTYKFFVYVGLVSGITGIIWLCSITRKIVRRYKQAPSVTIDIAKDESDGIGFIDGLDSIN